MKKVLIAAVAIILSVGCAEKKHGAFVVTGEIKNAPDKKVLLMEESYNSPQPLILDSTTIGKDGSFTLKGRANEEGIYRLVIEKGPYVIVINDNETIRVKMDINDYRNYTIEGSEASESLHTLFENYRAKDSVLFSTFKQLDTLQKQPGNDSLVLVIQGQKDQQMADLNNYIKNYVENSPSPAARFYAIGLASRTIPMEELKPLADASANKFKDHSGLAKLKSMLTVQAAPKKAPAYKLLNQPAPNLTMPDINGKTVSLSDFKGKYVLVDFWASWCAPCRAENPNVVAAYNKFKDRNFTIVGVSLDEDKAAWQQAITKDKLTWTHISDLKQWESAAVPTYGFDGIPFNVLIDPDGKIIANGLRGEELERKLEEVLR